MEKRLPTGIQDFRKLVEGNFIYVDKTPILFQLIVNNNYAFLSRPRRFGKSLLVSVLEEYFTGNKELFKGLDIYDKSDWKKHPVIRLDFSDMTTENDISFSNSLLKRLRAIAKLYSVSIDADNPSDYFSELLGCLHLTTGSKVVLLIDEYDKPITDHLTDIVLGEKMRELLKTVFIRMKGNDSHIEFVFLTGVSKFANVSLFSGLNQISDISLDDNYATLLGYTQEELEKYFGEYIEQLSEKFSISKVEMLDKIRYWYNGYSWNGLDKVYNPFSILNFFKSQRFDNYWFYSGTPTHLVKLIRERKFEIGNLKNIEANILTFDSNRLDKIEPLNLLFQTGYLTITSKRYLYEIEEFILNFPNFEVKTSFFSFLLGDITDSQPSEALSRGLKLRYSLETENIEQFKIILESLFAQIPSNLYIAEERFYHSLFIMIMYLSGIEVDSEVSTNIGRIDGVIEFSDKVYILEFKFNRPAEDGLKQILEKKYYQKYLDKGKPIHLIGVGFTRQEIEFLVLGS
jgi:hypothetical protein